MPCDLASVCYTFAQHDAQKTQPKLNLMIKLLQLPSDTLSVRRARRACPALSSLIENSHTSGVIHPRSLFSEAKTTQKGP